MAAIAAIVRVDSGRMSQDIDEIRKKLESEQGEITLDLSSVSRIDSGAVSAFRVLAETAREKAVKVTLRDVRPGIYKALTLVELVQCFSFVS